MAESSQNAPDPAKNAVNTIEMVHKRLEDLQKRRQDLVERLEQEMALALSPLDASIKELGWMLSQLGGNGAAPPEYNLFKRSQSAPSSAPQAQVQIPTNVAQFKPARSQPTKDLPPPSFTESPQTKTPVATNEGILRQALQKNR